MRNLEFYRLKDKIVNNDVRYIGSQVVLVDELKSLFNWAKTDNLTELLYIFRNGFTNYPSCEVCKNLLTSKSFVNGKRGYRNWCSRSCSRNSPEYKLQIKETSQKLYGTNHPFSSDLVQTTRKKTNLTKYGIANPMSWSGDLFKNAMIENYGSSNNRNVPEIDIKIRATIKSRNEKLFSNKLVSHLNDLQITPVNDIDISDRFKDHQFVHVCGSPIQSTIDKLFKIRCFNCHRPKNLSQFQYEVENFVISLGFNVNRNDRTIIAPLELDITIPDKKIAIETHGDYWHTNQYKNDNDHQVKADLIENCGWSLIQIFESEWKSKKSIIKSLISCKLGKSTKVFARKLKIVELSISDESDFFNSSHLQGYIRSSKCIGLSDGNTIFCAMSFNKPRFNKQVDWELIRFANLINHQVLGGASKLLKNFAKQFCGEKMLSYADRRISTGGLYKTLGFELVSNTKPNYWYVNFKKDIKLTRYQAQKGKLSKLLGEDFLEGLTERENMILNGYRVIHDAGNHVFIKIL